MKITSVRNNTQEEKIWIKTFEPGETYLLPTDNQIVTKYANSNTLLCAIANGEASIGNGDIFFTTVNDQINWLKNLTPQEVSVTSSSPFSAKTIGDKKLFKRVHGIQVDVVTGNNIISWINPYAWAKITSVEVINGESLDKSSLKVYDSETGIISGTPNTLLNQFAFETNVSKDFYEHYSEYEADLVLGLKLEIIYFSVSNKKIGINFVLNEVK